MEKDSIKFDPEKTKELLQDWKEKLENAQKGHYSQCERLGTINTWVGVILIVASTVVTGLIFFNWSDLSSNPKKYIYFYGVLSIAVAVISGVISFSRFSDRATEHRITAGNYGKLRRKLESIAIISSDEYHTDNFKHKLKTLRIEWEYVASLAPLTPKIFISKQENISDADSESEPEKQSEPEKKTPTVIEFDSIFSKTIIGISLIIMIVLLLIFYSK
ncbi:SLATT domain-containing protein [Morganella morganii]|uniref:SLATT domain-containing protein n=1 Tax=Morganella morganii TaxID=582 RepID=UPI000F474FED|nr:SLATT domain-containing protein [Morganella morganii]ROJ31501.1 hypothetical protein BFD15_04785 [Morganella morganii]